MHKYTDEQLARYFARIQYDGGDARQKASSDPLGFLTTLQRHHLAHVPFESLSLHYSKLRLLSLDLEDLFTKIVDNGRGGYCMEVNAFFAAVLRSLGYTLITSGARVKGAAGYNGWDHMVILVTISEKRYLVDVGFGANCPTQPVLLEHGHTISVFADAPVNAALQYRGLDEHSDPNQRVWVYSVQENSLDSTSPWKDLYAFVDIEFFPGDFEVMNLKTMTAPDSHFVQNVVCVCTVLDQEGETTVGQLILHRNYLKRRTGLQSEMVQSFESEEQRVRALEEHFGIVLSQEEQGAIRGLASELRSKGAQA